MREDAHNFFWINTSKISHFFNFQWAIEPSNWQTKNSNLILANLLIKVHMKIMEAQHNNKKENSCWNMVIILIITIGIFFTGRSIITDCSIYHLWLFNISAPPKHGLHQGNVWMLFDGTPIVYDLCTFQVWPHGDLYQSPKNVKPSC